MTDATSGPGAEGAPRDGKPRERATVPPAAPGRDPVTGAKMPGNVPTEKPDDRTDRSDRSAADTGRDRAAGNPQGTPEGPDNPPGTPGSHGPSGTTGEAAPLITGSEQSHGSRDAEHGRDTHGPRLLPHDESDKLSLRLQHAVAGFVDGPKTAVEEADHVLEEAAARFTDAVTQRRRTLRNSWQSTDGKDTEQLRLALRDYRELAERLLRT